ncbi:hypothetical protein E2C01_032150 [Portunus trituberculatus]|uniref:Uncharacterized protein n=1 Tax=Portunus trituberculatus TaxID=210409 RepID=A0A5B7F066_PORTR|nr:hypothetical protein [Portunus trituberculatus]
MRRREGEGESQRRRRKRRENEEVGEEMEGRVKVEEGREPVWSAGDHGPFLASVLASVTTTRYTQATATRTHAHIQTILKRTQ